VRSLSPSLTRYNCDRIMTGMSDIKMPPVQKLFTPPGDLDEIEKVARQRIACDDPFQQALGRREVENVEVARSRRKP
jgi:hypothetical protein